MSLLTIDQTIAELKIIARKLRGHMLRMAAGKGQGYIGQGLGMADLMVAIYFHELNFRADEPTWPERDRFLLSTGHYSIALWAALAEAGVLPVEELAEYGADGSRVEMSTLDATPGVEMTGGSLGHGLGQGVGMSLALRLQNRASRVFVELSDGELQEGSTWEAAMAASHFRLDNLIAIVDCNGIQADGPIVLGIEPVAEKWRAFGWQAVEIDGNNMEEVVAALHAVREPGDQPKVIIAYTIPGKGVPAIENSPKSHFVRLDEEQWAAVLNEFGDSSP